MSVITQGVQKDEFLISEATGFRSRESEIVTVAGSVALPSGTVLGRITASGKLIKYSNAASDGSQTAVAILSTPCPGVNGDYKCQTFNRDCEVIGDRLNGYAGVDAAGKVELTAIGIIVR
jgi:hypothetical protein